MTRSCAGLVVALWLAAPAHGQVEVVDEAGTLRGLEGVEIVVESVDVEADWHGLSTASLQADVARRLTEAKVPVLDSDTGRPQPWLYVRVQVRAGRDRRKGVFAVTMSLQLRQAVTLARDPNLLGLATTWAASDGVSLFEEDDLERVRERLGQLVDLFVTAYRTANPPTAP